MTAHCPAAARDASMVICSENRQRRQQYSNSIPRTKAASPTPTAPCRASCAARDCSAKRNGGAARKRRRRQPRAPREMRSFEVEHVHGLWHLDFHDGSRRVLTAAGDYKTPQLLGILDDRSRLCCHLQWYLTETAEVLVQLTEAKISLSIAPSSTERESALCGRRVEVVGRLSRLRQAFRCWCPASSSHLRIAAARARRLHELPDGGA